VTPKTHTDDLIQCGEKKGTAFDEDFGYYDYTYTTCKKEDGYWIYCGDCFANETLHRAHDDFAQDKAFLESGAWKK